MGNTGATGSVGDPGPKGPKGDRGLPGEWPSHTHTASISGGWLQDWASGRSLALRAGGPLRGLPLKCHAGTLCGSHRDWVTDSRR